MSDDEFLGFGESGMTFGPLQEATLYGSAEEAEKCVRFPDEKVVTIHETVYLIQES